MKINTQCVSHTRIGAVDRSAGLVDTDIHGMPRSGLDGGGIGTCGDAGNNEQEEQEKPLHFGGVLRGICTAQRSCSSGGRCWFHRDETPMTPLLNSHPCPVCSLLPQCLPPPSRSLRSKRRPTPSTTTATS